MTSPEFNRQGGPGKKPHSCGPQKSGAYQTVVFGQLVEKGKQDLDAYLDSETLVFGMPLAIEVV